MALRVGVLKSDPPKLNSLINLPRLIYSFMRYLGVDYGRKRIGLSLSDPAGSMAFPRMTASNLEEVLEFIGREEVGTIVIGLPISFDGKESAQVAEIRAFAEELKRAVELPIEFENEIFTSKIAERTSSRDHADAAAAAIILQSYLDRVR